jgi:hypothetical protein
VSFERVGAKGERLVWLERFCDAARQSSEVIFRERRQTRLAISGLRAVSRRVMAENSAIAPSAFAVSRTARFSASARRATRQVELSSP